MGLCGLGPASLGLGLQALDKPIRAAGFAPQLEHAPGAVDRGGNLAQSLAMAASLTRLGMSPFSSRATCLASTLVEA